MSLYFTFSQFFARAPASSHLLDRGTGKSLTALNYTSLTVLTRFELLPAAGVKLLPLNAIPATKHPNNFNGSLMRFYFV